MDVLRERLDHFHRLIEHNNQLLELIAEAGEMLGGEYIFDIQYLRALAQKARDACHEVVDHLNAVTHGGFPELTDVFCRLATEIDAVLEGRIVVPPSDLIIPLTEVDDSMVDVVGAKMARLGALARECGLTIPEGFVVSTSACQLFLEENEISAAVDVAFATPGPYSATELAERAERLRALILAARMPRPLRRALQKHVRKLAKHHQHPSFAVRSSALGEDGELSFAGQFLTELGVTPEDIFDAYRRVIASAYSEEVMAYRQRAGLHPARSLMAVGCLRMVRATAGGVLYSLDPADPARQSLQVTVVPGLGKAVVDGSAPADRFTLSRAPGHPIEERRVVLKNESLQVDENGTVSRSALPESRAEAPALSDATLHELARLGLVIERQLKCAVDVEWALAPDATPVVLQARPLKVVDVPARRKRLTRLENSYQALMKQQGDVACNGVAAGPVVVIEDDELSAVPDGAVLVARTSTPRLSVAVPRASAVITDLGTTTSHLATIAREFRVPTIVDTGNATELLSGHDVVTVDANSKVVYAGRVDELLHQHLLHASSFEDTKEFRMLRRVLRRIAPLHLRDPQAREFTAKNCSSYHDIIRFAHEKAVQELAEGDWLEPSGRTHCVHRLDLQIPLDLVLVDLGGGLHGSCIGRKRVQPESIESIPLRALIDGVTTEGVWETNPTRMDPNAFMASATRAPPWLSSARSRPPKNLAIVSRNYLNLNIRLGFHFTIVDCFLGDARNDNYIFFRFAGGVTEQRRREHRAMMLQRIFAKHDFLVEIKSDLVTARIKKISQGAMVSRLRMIGRLIGYSRQLDIVLSSEEAVEMYANKFLEGRFGGAGSA